MSPECREMFELGRRILALAYKIELPERDGWYHFFGQAWGYAMQAKRLGQTSKLFAEFGDEETFAEHMKHRLARRPT